MTVSDKRLGLLFALIGPPGVGKNSLMNPVIARLDDLRQLPTATTRLPRQNEVHGREHFFVSEEEFKRMLANKELLESQVIHDHLYGIPRSAAESAIRNQQDVILDVDVLGATYLRSIYPDNTVLIWIQPPSEEDLIKRMQQRGEDEEEIARRLERLPLELPYAPLCDYLIYNENMDHAAEVLYAIVLAERSRRALVNLRAAQGLPRHRYVFAAIVIPAFEGEVLIHEKMPNFPTRHLVQGELPHEAALRALSEDLHLPADAHRLTQNVYTAASFIPPLALDTVSDANHGQISFVYLYTLDERVIVSEGWRWLPYEQVELPPVVTEAISIQRSTLR